MKIRNTSGLDLIVPGLGGRLVPAGAVVDVGDDVAGSYLVCDSMWTGVDKADKADSEKGTQS